ncbi:biotin transporter BioY [Leifsonia virtsii]|uniref:Biotin transporter n=1 Tax=Leifsonia virtsii TaxID=3035915 RepID=A0ABT8IWV5_9MICO|nr:ECF transporter S component [Leifsonia virtsii]MDN4597295.1 biotin transporter BioY [Leifsonia virtsii]
MTLSTPTRRRLDATDLARVAVFAAIVAVLGLPGGISVFGSVPITAQTLGVMLAGAILGPWLGALSMAVLLALVALGLPLLSGGTGGLGVFVGPTAGYLFGWIVGAFVIGLIVHAGNRRPVWWRTLLGMVVGGILVVYAFGVPVTSLVLRLPLDVIAKSSLVFVPGDLAKAVIATAIVMTLVRAYPRAFRRNWVTPRGAAAPEAEAAVAPASEASEPRVP